MNQFMVGWSEQRPDEIADDDMLAIVNAEDGDGAIAMIAQSEIVPDREGYCCYIWAIEKSAWDRRQEGLDLEMIIIRYEAHSRGIIPGRFSVN